MEIVLPIYINTSKNKKVLMSLNWYRNSHYGIKDKVKKQYHEMVFEQLRGVKYTFKSISYGTKELIATL